MKIYKEENLSSFEFWSGAKSNAEKLTIAEFDQIESILEDSFSEGMSETQINDLFWFDFETIAEWINKSVCEDCGELFQYVCDCKEEEEDEEEEI